MNENNTDANHPTQGVVEINSPQSTINPSPVAQPSQPSGESQSKIGFILSLSSILFSFLTSVPALIFSIIGASQSRKSGRTNKIAVAGIVISSLNIIFNIVLVILFLIFVLPSGLSTVDQFLAQECTRLGPGEHSLTNGRDGLRKRELIITCGSEGKIIDMKEGKGPLRL